MARPRKAVTENQTAESAPVTETHEIAETIKVDYLTPGHQPRGAESDLFRRSKRALEHMQARALTLFRPETGRCYICGKTEEELSEPLEAHHFSIEWSFANGEIDWKRVEEDHPRYDWSQFNPADPMHFVDDMIEQGMLLCKKHHTGKDSGIHNLPFSIWIMQRYLKHGVKFSETETIDKSKDWQ